MAIESTKSLVEGWKHKLTLVDPDSGMHVRVSGTVGDKDVTLTLERESAGAEDKGETMGFIMPGKDFLALADRVRKSMSAKRGTR
jgi:hypothetical protein